MARPDKRTRDKIKRAKALSIIQAARANAVQGDRSLTRGSLDNLWPIVTSKRKDWSFNAANNARIRRENK